MLASRNPSRRSRDRRTLPAALLLNALAALFLADPTHAEPMVPADDAMVLDHLPAASDPAAAQLRRLQSALARQPDNLPLALDIARRDVALARARFDPRFNGYAEAALAQWWHLPDPPAAVRLLRATVRQSSHDFDAALIDLDALIGADTANAQAILTRAIVHQVRAEYEQAAADCARFAAIRPGLAALTCSAALRGVGPGAAAAYNELAAAYDAPDGPAAPELRVWTLTVLGELAARIGDAGAAERRFRAALAIAGSDGYLLGVYADHLLDQNRPGDVAALLAAQTQVDPLLLRLALAEQLVGAPEAAGHIADLADRFAASAARGETVHRREEARFALELLHEPHRALRLAVANWQVQREPADARVLLECALAARAPDDAAPALAWLNASGFIDQHLIDLGRALRATRPAG